jgi:hypothetical protein
VYLFSNVANFANVIAVLGVIVAAGGLIANAIFQSAEYKAKQNTKLDIAKLLTTIYNVRMKYALRYGQNRQVDFSVERQQIRGFLASTTCFALYMYAGHKHSSAKSRSESWRTFHLILVEASENLDDTRLLVRCNQLEELIRGLKRRDYKTISSYLSNIHRSLSKAVNVAGASPINKAVSALGTSNQAVTGSAPNNNGGEGMSCHKNDLLNKFLLIQAKLKSIGRSDPDVDLFVGAISGDTEIVKDALARGADLKITDSEVLHRHRNLDTSGNP